MIFHPLDPLYNRFNAARTTRYARILILILGEGARLSISESSHHFEVFLLFSRTVYYPSREIGEQGCGLLYIQLNQISHFCLLSR